MNNSNKTCQLNYAKYVDEDLFNNAFIYDCDKLGSHSITTSNPKLQGNSTSHFFTFKLTFNFYII